MNSLVNQFSSSSSTRTFKDVLSEQNDEFGEASWGSAAGFGNLGASGIPSFQVPMTADVRLLSSLLYVQWLIECNFQPISFLRTHTDDHADPSCRIKIQHGTTTLAFRFKGGIIVAVDSRATAGSYIGILALLTVRPY